MNNMFKLTIKDNGNEDLVVMTNLIDKLEILKFNQDSLVADYFKTAGLTIERLNEFLNNRVYRQSKLNNIIDIIKETNLKNFKDEILVYVQQV